MARAISSSVTRNGRTIGVITAARVGQRWRRTWAIEPSSNAWPKSSRDTWAIEHRTRGSDTETSPGSAIPGVRSASTRKGASSMGTHSMAYFRTISGGLAMFRWPPPHENYVYEGLQGALVQAVILKRAGFDAFNWGDQALLRAVRWLYDTAHFHAVGDDTWIPYVVNYFYGTNFPAPEAARAGKNVGLDELDALSGSAKFKGQS